MSTERLNLVFPGLLCKMLVVVVITPAKCSTIYASYASSIKSDSNLFVAAEDSKIIVLHSLFLFDKSLVFDRK